MMTLRNETTRGSTVLQHVAPPPLNRLTKPILSAPQEVERYCGWQRVAENILVVPRENNIPGFNFRRPRRETQTLRSSAHHMAQGVILAPTFSSARGFCSSFKLSSTNIRRALDRFPRRLLSTCVTSARSVKRLAAAISFSALQNSGSNETDVWWPSIATEYLQITRFI